MLTFEKVLEVFKNYLTEDDMYEVIFTSHGYTLLEWDRQCGEWTGVKLCMGILGYWSTVLRLAAAN